MDRPGGEGNGKPLQYSCLENPRDRGAWWAAVYGVAQSWTRLKQLRSTSRIDLEILTLGAVSQTKKMSFDITYMWNLKKKIIHRTQK